MATQAQVAEKIGVSQQTISRFINLKQNFTLRRAEKIADKLGVDVGDLLKRDKLHRMELLGLGNGK